MLLERQLDCLAWLTWRINGCSWLVRWEDTANNPLAGALFYAAPNWSCKRNDPARQIPFPVRDLRSANAIRTRRHLTGMKLTQFILLMAKCWKRAHWGSMAFCSITWACQWRHLNGDLMRKKVSTACIDLSNFVSTRWRAINQRCSWVESGPTVKVLLLSSIKNHTFKKWPDSYCQ